MVTALAAASAALATLAVVGLVARARRVRARRRLEGAVRKLDAEMQALSERLQGAVGRASELGAGGVSELELTVDLDELLRRVAAEAVSRTGAHAATVHVVGAGGETAVGSFGAEDGAELPARPLGPGARPFRAVTMDWAYRHNDQRGMEEFVSALVVPIVESGVETGTLTAYARAAGAFGPEQVRALEALAEQAALAIAGARRHAELERTLTDPLTRVRNRRGYEDELERAVARASVTGQPLSVVVLSLDRPRRPGSSPEAPSRELALQVLAAVLREVAREADVIGRRAEHELAVVLPDTVGDAARSFYARLQVEASRRAFPHAVPATFAAGVVEWRPRETTQALDARASAAVGESRVKGLELGGEARDEGIPARPRVGLATADQAELDEHLAREVGEARRLERGLALILLAIAARPAEPEEEAAADSAVAEVEARLAERLTDADLTCRAGRGHLAVLLPGSGVADAERVLGQLRDSLEREPPEGLDPITVAAGITELAPGDDAKGVAARAEHALRRAEESGHGRAVVHLASGAPGRRPRPPAP